jgi:AcrR family transcriptional regulator
MTLVSDHTESDTRSRILIAAEKLFREIGYQKTTVADIAKLTAMSPANVYRFFDSKKAIHEGVAVRLMSEVEVAVAAVAARPGSAAARLSAVLAAIYRLNVELFIGDAKLHEMVMMAMEQNWDACDAHVGRLVAIIGEVIADGVAAGEFTVADVPKAAQCTCMAMIRFFHPYVIKECANKPEPTLEQMTSFVLAALGGASGTSSKSGGA